MKHFTLWKSFLLLCALVVGSNAWGAEVTIAYAESTTTNMTGNNDAAKLGLSATDWSVVGARGGNNNFPGLNKSHYIALYYNATASNTLTVTSLQDYNINSITITYTEDSYNNGKVLVGGDEVTGTNGTYTINSTSFVVTNGNTSNVQVRISSIVINYTSAAPTKVATPSISGTEKFLNSTEVTITCGTEDAAIQYSTDGGSNWSDYTAPFTLTETTTVTAKATDQNGDLDDSDPASKTFTKITPMTVAEAIDYIGEGENLTGQYVTGKISQIDSYASGAITYWISDDGTATGQMEVYKGKGLNSANFSAVTDLNVGDVVTVYGTLQLYGTTYEFSAGSSIIARIELPASDITKTADVTLDFKNGATDADLTDYFTTSSTGVITYTVADETVIERDDELISALKVGTTTVTVSQAATLYYKAGEITINVTVQDTREAATTIPAINISTLKVGDAGTISVTNPVKADDGVTFAYTSSDDDVLIIVDDEYEALTVGTVTVTVTATPSNTNLYKSVVQEFTNVMVEAAVKTDNAIVLDANSGSTEYGTPKSVNYEVETGYDGALEYSIDNSAIADVEIGASSITFTPKATGTAVITLSAPATATFNAADDVEYTLTITAPAGGTTGAAATFDKVTSVSAGDYLIVYEDGNVAFDGSLETLDAVGNTVEVEISENTIAATSALKAAVFTIAAVDGGYTVRSKSGQYIGQTSDANGLATNGETAYTNTISFDSDGNANLVSGGAYLRYNSASNQTRFRYYKSSSYTNQKAIQLYKDNATVITATLNASGYATFCSQYPLDFSDYATADYSAWQVTSIGSGAITFEQVKGKVKGGTGLLLKGEAGATVTLTSADSDNELTGNKLVGTLAPLYVAANEYYGLSGTTFVRMNAGTVKAGKAIIPAGEIPTSAQNLTFVFEDNTTGINTVNDSRFTVNGEAYNLAGQKVSESYKGIVIVNGKKMIRK